MISQYCQYNTGVHNATTVMWRQTQQRILPIRFSLVGIWGLDHVEESPACFAVVSGEVLSEKYGLGVCQDDGQTFAFASISLPGK